MITARIATNSFSKTVLYRAYPYRLGLHAKKQHDLLILALLHADLQAIIR